MQTQHQHRWRVGWRMLALPGCIRTSGPKTRRSWHVKLLLISLHCDLYVDGVSVGISKSDIMGGTLKK
ncbi:MULTISPECIES: hypothetical protein [unclassified Microcoleus]|uniref:hypothetical protein n=1 Tax=unclassified Microcoleus TaxID=2642155 RepID=UPI0025FF0315|nr:MULTISPECIES: hypothetical protein [unclassified Microcoleus]